jgi:hypothetical protein
MQKDMLRHVSSFAYFIGCIIIFPLVSEVILCIWTTDLTYIHFRHFMELNMFTCQVKYRMAQEERSIFWEVIVFVVLSKKVYMYMCSILNGFRHRAISLYSSLDLVPNIVLPSRPTTPLSEACESV